jgi:putative transposase
MTNWPHAPHHAFNQKGTYMVTGSTLDKKLLFKTQEELDLLQAIFLNLASHYQWHLEAWALFPNHYHFIAQSPNDPKTLKKLISHLHATTARELNRLHQTPGRKVWYQYWDSLITFQISYLARLNYVMQNPVKHGMVAYAKDYKWCSAAWFEANASKSQYLTVTNFKTDQVSVIDDF